MAFLILRCLCRSSPPIIADHQPIVAYHKLGRTLHRFLLVSTPDPFQRAFSARQEKGLACETSQQVLDTRKQFVIHQIVSLAIINRLFPILNTIWLKQTTQIVQGPLLYLRTNLLLYTDWNSYTNSKSFKIFRNSKYGNLRNKTEALVLLK